MLYSVYFNNTEKKNTYTKSPIFFFQHNGERKKFIFYIQWNLMALLFILEKTRNKRVLRLKCECCWLKFHFPERQERWKNNRVTRVFFQSFRGQVARHEGRRNELTSENEKGKLIYLYIYIYICIWCVHAYTQYISGSRVWPRACETKREWGGCFRLALYFIPGVCQRVNSISTI